MIPSAFNALQIRELFHLEFLRWLGRSWETKHYCLKGGVNLRLFFNSIRYSEDMDIDIGGMRIEKVKKTIMNILEAKTFLDNLRSSGIEKIVSPDIKKAKQTETTQRFKIHLLTTAGEDLFTKIEFSRRGMKGACLVESISPKILRPYKMMALLVPHYDAISAIQQKVRALAQRSALQARDVFDLFILSSQYDNQIQDKLDLSKTILKTAQDRIFMIEYLQFRDTVVAYLEAQDQALYSSPSVWDEIKLKTAHFLESF